MALNITDEQLVNDLAFVRTTRSCKIDRINAQRKPYLVDTLGGFVIEAVPGAEGGRRFVEVIIAEWPYLLVTYDTGIAGTQDVDKAKVRSLVCQGWDDISAYLDEEGLSLAATLSGAEAHVTVFDGGLDILPVTPSVNGLSRAHVKVIPGGVVATFVPVDGETETCNATDWCDAEDWLSGRGVTLRVVQLPLPQA